MDDYLNYCLYVLDEPRAGLRMLHRTDSRVLDRGIYHGGVRGFLPFLPSWRRRPSKAGGKWKRGRKKRKVKD
jgi:hypothetical protein